MQICYMCLVKLTIGPVLNPGLLASSTDISAGRVMQVRGSNKPTFRQIAMRNGKGCLHSHPAISAKTIPGTVHLCCVRERPCDDFRIVLYVQKYFSPSHMWYPSEGAQFCTRLGAILPT